MLMEGLQMQSLEEDNSHAEGEESQKYDEWFLQD